MGRCGQDKQVICCPCSGPKDSEEFPAYDNVYGTAALRGSLRYSAVQSLLVKVRTQSWRCEASRAMSVGPTGGGGVRTGGVVGTVEWSERKGVEGARPWPKGKKGVQGGGGRVK